MVEISNVNGKLKSLVTIEDRRVISSMIYDYPEFDYESNNGFNGWLILGILLLT